MVDAPSWIKATFKNLLDSTGKIIFVEHLSNRHLVVARGRQQGRCSVTDILARDPAKRILENKFEPPNL